MSARRRTFPETPDRLMLNFRTAYAARDLAGYAATLHPDFTFVETTGGSYGRDVELRIAARMFGGEDKATPAGTISGIARIEVVQFRGAGVWEADDGDGDGDVRDGWRILRLVDGTG